MTALPLPLTSVHTLRRPRVAGAALAGILGGAFVLATMPAAREAVLLAALAVGAWWDICTRRVPNWLTAGAGTFALVSGGLQATPLLGGLAALGCGALLVALARGAYGMGDVKAMAVAGAIVGLERVPLFLFWMAMTGGLCVAILAVCRGRLSGETMPYAPAIAAGATLALLLAP